ncbi:MAG: hypothetical protein BJ554DRAFT_7035, partial [Olpidium bornovanus]
KCWALGWAGRADAAGPELTVTATGGRQPRRERNMAPTEQTAVFLADSLPLSLVPERFVTDLFGDAGDQGCALPASVPLVDELNLEPDADETEPCVAAASVEVLIELNDLLQRWCAREDAEEFWALFATHDSPAPTETLPGSVARPKHGAITVRRLIAFLNKLVGLADPYSVYRATRGLLAAVAYLRLLRVKGSVQTESHTSAGSRAYGGFYSLAFQAVVRFLGEYPKLLEPSNILHDAVSVDVSYDEMEVVDAQAAIRTTRKDIARCFEIVVKELELLASSVSFREFHEEALQIAEFFTKLTSIACTLKKFESAIYKLHSEGGSTASADTSYARVDDGVPNAELHRMGVVLLQQICIRVPDRAEIRERVAEVDPSPFCCIICCSGCS